MHWFQVAGQATQRRTTDPCTYQQASRGHPSRCTYCHNIKEEKDGVAVDDWHWRDCKSPLVSHQPVHAPLAQKCCGSADVCAQRAQCEPEAVQSTRQYVAASQGVPMTMAVSLLKEDGMAGQSMCAHGSALPHSSGIMMLLHGCADLCQSMRGQSAQAAWQRPRQRSQQGPRPKQAQQHWVPIPTGPNAAGLHAPGLGARQILKVLLGGGSSDCALNKRHAHLAELTGKVYTTSMADGANVSSVPQARCDFSVQGQRFSDVSVLLMDTSDEFDAILGLDWMRQHHVVLKWTMSARAGMLRQGQISSWVSLMI